MSVVDRLNFSEEKIFQVLCERSVNSDGKTKNLIDCKNDTVFAWHSKKKCLLAQNVKVFNRDDTVYQELYPAKPPFLDVQFVRLNESVTAAALWGTTGVMVMEIPKRWGARSGFQGGKLTILTRSDIIDLTYILLNNNKICQVRFHPGSPQDNHLVILTSDNFLRVYRLPTNDSARIHFFNSELVYVWSLGQVPAFGRGWNLRGSKIPFLASLGDLAVDFDFGLPVLENEKKMDSDEEFDEVIWPTVILRGNGDVCYMGTSVISNKKPTFEGPVSMYPPADDNYGVEACSILVLHTVPSVVVVATSSGTLYHSVLLKIDQEEKNVISNSTHALYVMECVELELGIQLNNDDPSYTCPIILHRDPVSRSKYYSTHNTGIHAVSVSFVSHIEKYFEKSSPERLCLEQPSTVEYLVCTRTNATPVLPVLGFAIITSTNIILAVLANRDVISLPLKISESLVNSDCLSDETLAEEMTPIKKLLQEPFDNHIRNILKRTVNQPLMKLDKKVTLSPQESLDLISRTTNILRQEYFAKFQLVRDETEQRVMTLKALLALHFDELSQLEDEKILLQAMAEKLAEKYEEIKDKQQVLNQRIENVVSAILQLEPIESLAEKKMKNDLVAVEEKVKTFGKSISTLKKKIDYQEFKKAEKNEEVHKNIQLGRNQVETIKTNLNKTSQEIAELVKVVSAIKKQLNISDA